MFGPEMLAGMEMVALVEFIGVDVFLMAYFSSAVLFLRSVIDKFKQFERNSCFGCFGVRIKGLPKHVNYALFYVPERTLSYLGMLTILYVFYMVTSRVLTFYIF